MKAAEDLIKKYQLQPHPEGGYFNETYRSEGIIPDLDRHYATSIYFLLTSDNFSAFHRIKQDEIWYFHQGAPLFIHCISSEGQYDQIELGLEGNAQPQHIVKAGTWFASSVKGDNTYSMVGCMVAPGFEFSDFELAKRVELIREFPQHNSIITAFTRMSS